MSQSDFRFNMSALDKEVKKVQTDSLYQENEDFRELVDGLKEIDRLSSLLNRPQTGERGKKEFVLPVPLQPRQGFEPCACQDSHLVKRAELGLSADTHRQSDVSRDIHEGLGDVPMSGTIGNLGTATNSLSEEELLHEVTERLKELVKHYKLSKRSSHISILYAQLKSDYGIKGLKYECGQKSKRFHEILRLLFHKAYLKGRITKARNKPMLGSITQRGKFI